MQGKEEETPAEGEAPEALREPISRGQRGLTARTRRGGRRQRGLWGAGGGEVSSRGRTDVMQQCVACTISLMRFDLNTSVGIVNLNHLIVAKTTVCPWEENRLLCL